MRILVMGSSGFIGGHVAAVLQQAGHTVEGGQRNAARPVCAWGKTVPLAVRGGLRTDRIPTPETDASLFAGADAVIHLIHDKALQEADRERFVAWYTAVEAVAASAGARQLYVSSYSARPDALSVYGRAKYAVEQLFLARGHSIVRPGLVLGDGGIVGRIMGLVRRLPVVPVPGGSSDKMPYISVLALGRALERMLSVSTPPNELNAFDATLSDLPTLLRVMARQEGLRRWFVPVPTKLTLTGLLAVEACGLRLPVTSDNLRGAMVNQAAIHVSNLQESLGIKESVEQAARSALRGQ